MFIAIKKCTFDKTYAKGETIPDKAIDKSMIKKLIKCGLISEYIEDNKSNKKKAKFQEQDVVK